MTFKSQAQRRKFAELLVEGKIANEEWNRETGARSCRSFDSTPRQAWT